MVLDSSVINVNIVIIIMCNIYFVLVFFPAIEIESRIMCVLGRCYIPSSEVDFYYFWWIAKLANTDWAKSDFRSHMKNNSINMICVVNQGLWIFYMTSVLLWTSPCVVDLITDKHWIERLSWLGRAVKQGSLKSLLSWSYFLLIE